MACEFGAGGAEVGVRKCLSVHTASLPPGCQSWLDSVVVLGGFCASARMAWPGCYHFLSSACHPAWVCTIHTASKGRLAGESNFLMGRICYQGRPQAWIFATAWLRCFNTQRIKVSHPLVLWEESFSLGDDGIKWLASSCRSLLRYLPAPTVCKKEREACRLNS